MKLIHAIRGGLFALLASAATVAQAGTIELEVNGLVCGFCAQGIEKTLREYPATSDVVVSLENRLVAVQLKDGTALSDDTLRTALQDAGYTVVGIQRTETPVSEIRARLKAGKARPGNR